MRACSPSAAGCRQKEGRHRCKGPPPPGPEAAAAAAAAAAEASKIAEAEAAEAEAAAAAATAAAAAAAEHGGSGRKRRAGTGKRVRWALPDSDEDEEHLDDSMYAEDSEDDAPKKRRAAVAAAVAAATAHESPLRPAPAAPALLSTPRGAAAAQLLAGLRGSGQLPLPLVHPLAHPPLLGKPAPAAAAPSQAAGCAALPLRGATWWQAAVRPEFGAQRATVPVATPAGSAAAPPAATKSMVAGPPVLPMTAPVGQLPGPAVPFAAVAPVPAALPLPRALPAVPLAQALPPHLEHALGQPAGLAVAASLGELLLLLKVS